MEFFRERRMFRKIQIPVFRMVQIGEAAFHQSADEIKRQSGAFIRAQQQARIRIALSSRKARRIHQVATERGEALSIARFKIL